MNRVCDQLKISPHFMRSVNLERDFSDPRALEGYIPTPEAESHLKQLANGLRKESGQRAWYLTGDFGSGKSSFALVLASLLARSTSEIPAPLRNLNSILGLSPRSPRYFPVLVTGSREVMAHAVLRSLVSALNSGLPAKTKLAARSKATQLLSQGEISDRDVVAVIEETSAELVAGGHFCGILLIIDELGKFLEYAALNPDAQDVFFLQSLAEAASRSKGAPIQLLGLLHQGIAEYAEKLSITAQKEWAKVGERFGSLTFTQPMGQIALLLSAALGVDSGSKDLRTWKKAATEAMEKAVQLGMFGPGAGRELSRLAPGLYPLHPTVIPVLARFFRRFGQNERSLFSFLLSSEPFALRAFAERKAEPDAIYRLSDFYDFAAYNFGQRLGAQSYRSHWNHIDAVVRGASNEDELTQRILKTIGLLNVLQEEHLCPTFEIVSLALGEPDKIKELLSKLCQRGLLYHRGPFAGYSLWPSASVNLEQRFIAATEAITHAAPIAQIVQEKLDGRPVVARRHYIQKGNLRYAEVRYVTSEDFTDGTGDCEVRYPTDAILFVVICETAAQRGAAVKTARQFTSDSPQRIVAVTPPLESLASYALNLERWLWVERTTPELKDDRFAAEEVDRQVKGAATALELRLQEHVAFRGGEISSAGNGVIWFYQGTEVQALSKKEKSLQEFLSDQFDRLFDLAPEIRNELVNRHTLSSAAAAARQKIFECMLKQADKPLLGLPEDRYPPEKSMYLSVLEAGRLHHQQKDKWEIAFPSEGDDPLNFRPALNAILEKLEEMPDRRVPVAELYDLLRSRPFGLRDGVIPIFLLAAFIVHETEIAIYEDDVFQPEIEENLMMRLAKRWETFDFQLCRITGVRKALISELAAVVDADRAESSHLLSIVRPLYLFVAGLPDYARNTDQLSPETLALRKAIEAAREPADLVFNKIPKVFGPDLKSKATLDPASLAKKLGQSITELRRCYPLLLDRMAACITESFRYVGPLSHWRKSIAGTAETIVVGIGDPEFRSFCIKLIDSENPDPEWLEALGSLLTRCPPSRWKDRDELLFNERIIHFSRRFSRVTSTYEVQNGKIPDDAIRISITGRDAEEKERVIGLSASDSDEVEKLRKRINKILPKGSQIALAALSKVIWQELGDDV